MWPPSAPRTHAEPHNCFGRESLSDSEDPRAGFR
jgi:hypothetical protein